MSKKALPPGTRCIGIGWDVGGWTGKRNAVAMAAWDGKRITHPAPPTRIRLPSPGCSLPDFVEHFLGDHARSWVEQALTNDLRLVIAVDAPLGLPRAFVQQVKNPTAVGFPDNTLPDRFIDNPLAYRDTDRTVAGVFIWKKPLSPCFDTLSNPSSVARCYTHTWMEEGAAAGFTLATTHGCKAPRQIIEVYPALAKTDAKRGSVPCKGYNAPIKKLGATGADEIDAAICAVLALGYHEGDNKRLPLLHVADGNSDEGAIWYPAGSKWRLPV